MTDPGSRTPELPGRIRMFQLATGFMAAPAISAAAKLGIADLVATTPQTADELAHATKTHAPSLRRLLQFLASLGIFAEDAAGKYQQTPLSETLRSESSESVRDPAIMFGSEFMWRPWAELCEALADGKPAFDRIYYAPFFNYLAAHPKDNAVFNAAMTSISSGEVSAIVAAYDFSGFERIVDVGGGHGALLHGILSANPKLRGVLADQPSIVADAASLRSGAIADRCEIVGIDFFAAIPEGADAYIEKDIIHDWKDEDALKILRNCRRAIRPEGKLLLIERILKPSNQPDPGRFMDMNMFVLVGGRERTEPEFRTLLRDAGFALTRVIPTRGLLSIIESKPA